MPNGKEGHRERMKQLFRETGLDGFASHNALELLLFYAVPRKDTKELARRLIGVFGGFDKVLEADYESLRDVEGVGEQTATYLKLILSSYRYYELERQKQGFVASSTGAAADYCSALFLGEDNELCYALCFDQKLKLINTVVVSQGSFNAAAVSVRRVVEITARNKAVSVILTHNHPGGNAVPTPQDIDTTKKVMAALAVIGVALQDHVVVGERDSLSMADAGLLHSMRQELSDQ